MAESPFYHANEHRHYPFVDKLGLPKASIVDFSCLVGLSSGFVAATHRVTLTSVTRTTSTSLTFSVEIDAPGVTAPQLTFTRLITDAEFTFEYSGADGFSGQLVTGDLTELFSMLPAVGDVLVVGAEFLPSLIQDLGKSYVSSINFWNADRTRVTAPPGCPDLVWPFTLEPHYQVQTISTGSVTFREGHNTTIKVGTQDNSIGFSAGSGKGLGKQCQEIPVFSGEVPPVGSVFLSGGPSCKETINSINGINAKNIVITTGAGINITADSANSAIRIDLQPASLEGCE